MEYSNGFEKVWNEIDKPLSSGRKEQGYKVYSVMEKQISQLKLENKDLKEKVEKIVNISDDNRTRHKYESTDLRQAIIEAKQFLKELSNELP